MDGFPIFLEFIQNQIGVVIERCRWRPLQSFLKSRLQKLSIEDLPSYQRFLIQSMPNSQKEWEELVQNLVVPHTFFYRNQADFQALAKLIKESIAQKPSINIWVAGCSTGEEVYSILLHLQEEGIFSRISDLHILGTDIHQEALGIAQQGRYSSPKIRFIPQKYHKYFQKDGEYWQILPSIRAKPKFLYHNLLQPHPPPPKGKWDFIFCRNVLIYFHPKTKIEIIRKFYQSLTENGCLFLGYSEHFDTKALDFRLENFAGSYFYRKTKSFRSPSHLLLSLQTYKLAQDIGPAWINRQKTKSSNSILPSPPSPNYPQIRQLIQQKKLQEAQQQLLEYLHRSPCPKGYILLADIYVLFEEFALGIEFYERALQLQKIPEVYLSLGFTFYSLCQYSSAVSYLQKRLSFEPKCALSHFYLGICHKCLSQPSSAKEHFQKARYFFSTKENIDLKYTTLPLLQGSRNQILKTIERELE
ncbi:MAG: hypothetical protein D6805_07740 [Planctomycetota bacterium]|nr:MAG: hypothetical protein D6805_07740 [Planctomycetota bacterium]